MRDLDEVLAAHPPPFTPTAIQLEDIRKFAAMPRCLGHEPVGSGKTFMGTYSALCIDPDHVVILVPPILIDGWVEWLRSLPGVGKVLAYDQAPAVRKRINLRDYGWIVASYGMYRNDHKRFDEAFADRRLMVIVDEAHNMKSYKSKLFMYVRDLVGTEQRLLELSGTPLSNPGDAYAYIKLNTPDVYPTNQAFMNIHVEKYDFFGNPEKWRNLDMIKQNLDRSRVMRTKEEVHAGLPKANFIPVYYDLDPEHMALYKKLMNDQLLEVEGEQIDASTAQLLYCRAQQIISNWALFSGDATKRPKVYDLIDEIVEDIGLGLPADPTLGREEASKLILWTQYKMTSASLHAYMQSKKRAKNEPPYGKAVAAWSGSDSRKAVQDFMKDPATTSLTASHQSAGAGLNPQYVCWSAIFVEFPTSSGQFTQACGRTDRIGQRYNPTMWLAIARGTVQQARIETLLKNDDLVFESGGSAQRLRDLIFPT